MKNECERSPNEDQCPDSRLKPAAPLPWRMDREISRSVLVRGSGDDEYACGQILGMDPEDLQLIEAAPELLAALKHLVRNGGPGDFPGAEAAIAKAEGR